MKSYRINHNTRLVAKKGNKFFLEQKTPLLKVVHSIVLSDNDLRRLRIEAEKAIDEAKPEEPTWSDEDGDIICSDDYCKERAKGKIKPYAVWSGDICSVCNKEL